ncbi:hypothetical protein V3C99_018813, partial [Haemonchus contortus]
MYVYASACVYVYLNVYMYASFLNVFQSPIIRNKVSEICTLTALLGEAQPPRERRCEVLRARSFLQSRIHARSEDDFTTLAHRQTSYTAHSKI